MTQQDNQPSSDFTLVDTPGKIRTLAFIKWGVLTLIAALVLYGFAFDKWDIDATQQKIRTGRRAGDKMSSSGKDKVGSPGKDEAETASRPKRKRGRGRNSK